ncbi:MAG: DUF819 family protein [Pirellulales bacterium]|nr:DUF819 family protein [Pirellulales bacterium]
MIVSPLGILATLAGVASFFHFLEKTTRWKLFDLFPPLLFIYGVPLLLSNTGVMSNKSPLYGWMSDTVLPMFLILMLLQVDVAEAVRVMGKGILVLLFGTAGVILGAPLAYLLVKTHLGPEGWKAFGVLAGSWIGGTGNMAAVSEGLRIAPADFGLAVLADALVYLVWLPVLLGSRSCARWFSRFARVDPRRIEMLERSSGELSGEQAKPEMRHVLYLLFLGLFFPWVSDAMSGWLPTAEPVLDSNSWSILLTTTFGILLSMTPAKQIPGSRPLAAALVILFVANMGARADLSGLAQRAPWFLLGAFIWIGLHGACCVCGARLFRVDIHSTAIASAANIGGIASAPIVAAYHNQKLVPVSILMALLGYAIGNYGAFFAAWLCYLAS